MDPSVADSDVHTKTDRKLAAVEGKTMVVVRWSEAGYGCSFGVLCDFFSPTPQHDIYINCIQGKSNRKYT